MSYTKLAKPLPRPDDQTAFLVPKVELQYQRINTLEQELDTERESGLLSWKSMLTF
jgi:hypothetical protein